MNFSRTLLQGKIANCFTPLYDFLEGFYRDFNSKFSGITSLKVYGNVIYNDAIESNMWFQYFVLTVCVLSGVIEASQS